MCEGEKKQRISLVQESRFDFNCAFLEVLEAEPKLGGERGTLRVSIFLKIYGINFPSGGKMFNVQMFLTK